MIPNPIRRALSTLEKNDLRFLLMGGQACVLYGAAEFSRDMDVHVLASPANLGRLSDAIAELEAEVIAVPPFVGEYLQRGHAVHFRCKHPEVDGLRLNVMSKMRGVDSFDVVWDRRTILGLEDGAEIPLLALPDLVAAKKTQRDKDWPMIRRLVEANYETFYDEPNPQRIQFWLTDLRTPELLIEAVLRFPSDADEMAMRRPAIGRARSGDPEAVQKALDEEMEREREADRLYWAPLRRELEALRRGRSRDG